MKKFSTLNLKIPTAVTNVFIKIVIIASSEYIANSDSKIKSTWDVILKISCTSKSHSDLNSTEQHPN